MVFCDIGTTVRDIHSLLILPSELDRLLQGERVLLRTSLDITSGYREYTMKEFTLHEIVHEGPSMVMMRWYRLAQVFKFWKTAFETGRVRGVQVDNEQQDEACSFMDALHYDFTLPWGADGMRDIVLLKTESGRGGKTMWYVFNGKEKRRVSALLTSKGRWGFRSSIKKLPLELFQMVGSFLFFRH